MRCRCPRTRNIGRTKFRAAGVGEDRCHAATGVGEVCCVRPLVLGEGAHATAGVGGRGSVQPRVLGRGTRGHRCWGGGAVRGHWRWGRGAHVAIGVGEEERVRTTHRCWCVVACGLGSGEERHEDRGEM